MDKKLYHELGFAKVDTHRNLRTGTDEVILCKGKTISQIVEIAQVILKSNNRLIATKANSKIFKAIKLKCNKAVFHKEASVITVNRFPKKRQTKTKLAFHKRRSNLQNVNRAYYYTESCLMIGVATQSGKTRSQIHIFAYFY